MNAVSADFTHFMADHGISGRALKKVQAFFNRPSKTERHSAHIVECPLLARMRSAAASAIWLLSAQSGQWPEPALNWSVATDPKRTSVHRYMMPASAGVIVDGFRRTVEIGTNRNDTDRLRVNKTRPKEAGTKENIGERMQGTVRPISLGRKGVIDLMHASVPLVVFKRTMRLERLVAARTSRAVRPSWATIFTKALSIVARDEPWLRTYYLKWPSPHFYELPKSIAMIAVVRDDPHWDVPVFVKINAPDELSLKEVERYIQLGKHTPLDDLQIFKRFRRVARMPLPLRRLVWALGLNVGRLRANNFGTFVVTSIASLGPEAVVVRTPGPNVISYGILRSDHAMELSFHWDHRIYDGMLIARALRRLEDVLNTDIAEELLAHWAPKSGSA